MKQHEREFFVYRIRSGKYFIDYNNIRLKIITPTIDEQFEAENVYINSLDKSGTSVSFVHGHLSAGPNCSIKCSKPSSPPAIL